MKETIKALIEMQKIDDQIVAKKHIKKELPERLKNLKENVKITKDKVDELKKAVEENTVQQSMFEKEIKSNQEKMAKYENQLLNIKTNKEYKALNNEISNLKNENSKIDEKIINAIDKESELKAMLKVATDEAKKAQKKLDSEENDLNKEIIQVDKDIDDLKAQRKEIAIKYLPRQLIKRYGMLITNKGGKAVSFVEKNSCSGCGVNLRPQLIIEIKKGQKIISCENCGRLLVNKPEEKEKEKK